MGVLLWRLSGGKGTFTDYLKAKLFGVLLIALVGTPLTWLYQAHAGSTNTNSTQTTEVK